MILLIWILNFGISWLNAWGCGKTWAETKSNGGAPHFMNWMGAVMSASGFTWCYTILAAMVGGGVTHEVNGQMVPYLSGAQVDAVMELGYLIVILPILGSGLALTVHSWGTFYRRRTFGDGAVAGWNTFAQASNMYHAARDIPGVFAHLSKFFKGSKSDSDNKASTLVLVLAVMCAFAGVLTTYTILTVTARSTATNRSFRYAENQ